MRGRVMLIIALLVLMLAVAAELIRRHVSQYDDMIALAASRNEVDFYLVKALIFEESWFRPAARGSSGELGLMQVTMAAARDYASKKGFPPFYEDRLLEPELNIEIGCWYLKQSLDLYENTPAQTLFALLRYNAGEARADSWLRSALSKPVPAGMSVERYYLSLVDFPKTREYVSRILERSRSRNFWF